MLHGKVLHPLHVHHIVDVAVLVDRSRGNEDGLGIDRGNGHASILPAASPKRGVGVLWPLIRMSIVLISFRRNSSWMSLPLCREL